MSDEAKRTDGLIPWHRLSDAIGARPVARIAAILILLLALAYLATRTGNQAKLIDGDQFWYAGWLWNHGINPYSDAFVHVRPDLMPEGTPPFFIYPLHFWIVCAPLALVDSHSARMVWAVANLAMLIGGAALWWRVARAWGQAATLQAWLLLVCAAIMSGTGFAIMVGQTSFLIWLGIALLASGVVERSRWQMVLGLVLLLLKPQFGLIFSVAFALCYRDIRVILAVIALVAVASLPAWVIGGPRTPLDFLHTLSAWADFPFNRLRSMTGIGNLVAVGLNVELSKQLLILAAVALSCGLLLAGGAEDRDRRFLAATLAAAALLAPLHLYDLFFVLAFPLLVLPPRRWWSAAALLVALLLLLRPENIAHLTGALNWTVATIGAVLAIAVPVIERSLPRPRAA